MGPNEGDLSVFGRVHEKVKLVGSYSDAPLSEARAS